MADGSVVIEVNANVAEAEKELAKLKKEIAKTQESVSKQEAKKAPLVQEAEELSAKMREARAQVEMYGQQWRAGVIGADKQQSQAIETLNGLKAQYDGVVRKIDKIDEKLIPASTKLENMKINAGSLEANMARTGAATRAMQTATATAQKHMAVFTKRVAGLAKRVLIFSIILRALHGILDFLKDAVKTSPEATAAIADLKGAMLTLAQPLVDVIIPAFTNFVNLLARIMTLLARFVSFAFGKTAEQSREAAKALDEQKKALDGVGGSAKKAGKSVASFDEINTLSSGADAGSGGGAGMDIKPDFSGVQAAMTEAEAYMSGALLALGAILAFSGASIPLGIGLMVAGAAGLGSALATDWGTMPKELKTAITKTMLLVGGGMLAVGAILAFATPLKGKGIALMVAGLAGIGGAVALNWNSIAELLKGPIGVITALVSGALLAIGAIIAFSGPHNLPLGIGLMIAGAAGLAATVAVNWDYITEIMRGKVGAIMAIVSGALIVLGIILLFTGAGTGLGIGLILAGAAGLATVVAFNWNFLSDKVKEVWGNIKSFWQQYIAPIFTKEWWLNLAKKCGNGLLSGFEKAINGIIGMFESMINWIVRALNKIQFDVPEWVPLIGGKKFGFNIPEVRFSRVTMPRLATGAVIPPNREFMAVLGDQKSGMNIETPLSTMIEAFTTAMQSMGMGGGQTVVMQIDGREFGRFVNKYGVRESNRIGVNLAGVK